MRGEYFHTSHPGMCAAGSSPRAWGILRARRQIYCIFRFIPTCVGNTPAGLALAKSPAVHPHVRGEYLSDVRSGLAMHGSSPRAWGILWESAAPWYAIRFIPTCVGNTVPGNRDERLDPVHPHVRGEYLRSSPSRGRRVGSSPRAWGIRPARYRCPVPDRFIPTCVGNTRCSSKRCKAKAVHPHVRGEYAT